MNCFEVQELLTDYVARETGPHVTEAIRVHLESCQDCRSFVHELTDTVEILLVDSRLPRPEARQLTQERRARIQRAVQHPALHWIESHHVLVSVLVAVLLVLLAAAAINYMTGDMQRAPDNGDDQGVAVWIRLPPGTNVSTAQPLVTNPAPPAARP